MASLPSCALCTSCCSESTCTHYYQHVAPCRIILENCLGHLIWQLLPWIRALCLFCVGFYFSSKHKVSQTFQIGVGRQAGRSIKHDLLFILNIVGGRSELFTIFSLAARLVGPELSFKTGLNWCDGQMIGWELKRLRAFSQHRGAADRHSSPPWFTGERGFALKTIAQDWDRHSRCVCGLQHLYSISGSAAHIISPSNGWNGSRQRCTQWLLLQAE